MADKVKIPVELTGVKRVMQEIAALSANVEKDIRAAIQKSGITTGKFQFATTEFYGIRRRDEPEITRALAERAARLQKLVEEAEKKGIELKPLGITTTIDIAKEKRVEELRKRRIKEAERAADLQEVLESSSIATLQQEQRRLRSEAGVRTRRKKKLEAQLPGTVGEERLGSLEELEQLAKARVAHIRKMTQIERRISQIEAEKEKAKLAEKALIEQVTKTRSKLQLSQALESKNVSQLQAQEGRLQQEEATRQAERARIVQELHNLRKSPSSKASARELELAKQLVDLDNKSLENLKQQATVRRSSEKIQEGIIKQTEMNDELLAKIMMERKRSRFEQSLRTGTFGSLAAERKALEADEVVRAAREVALKQSIIGTSGKQREMLLRQLLSIERERDEFLRREVVLNTAVRRITQERNRRISQGVMGVAATGIGAFGMAGFPLLNIAFASMSGPVHAFTAAIATATGEGTRAILRLQDAAMASADSLGLLTKEFKIARKEYEAAKAVYGGVSNIAMERSMKEWIDALGKGRGMFLTAYFANIRADFRNILIHPFKALTAFGTRSMEQALRDIADSPKELRKAREEMLKQLIPFQPSFMTGQDLWKQIQVSVAGRKESERMLLEKQIQMVDKMIEAAELQSEAAKKQLENIRQIDEIRKAAPALGNFSL